MTLRGTGLQSDSDLDLVMFTGSNNAVVYKIDEYQVLWTSPPSTHHPPMDPQTKQLTDIWTITILFDMILIISMIFMKKTA